MNYDDRQKFEHELIDRKLRWLLTSQTILFAALALVFNKGKPGDMDNDGKTFLTILLCILGLLTSTLTAIGVISAVIGKYRSYGDERKKDHRVQWGVRTRLT